MARIRKDSRTEKAHCWKIALYIRLSKEDGNDESLSVTNQRKILQEYIQNNFTEDYTIIDAYIDDGKTGTDVNRPDFIRMEQDIKAGRINCVIVKSLARAFRNLGDQQKYLEEFFPLNGVRFINLGTPFIDTHINPRGATGLDVPIHGMFNEQFAASTSEEVRKTFNTKRREGEFIGAFAPYGYKKHPENKNRLIIDEEAAQVVRDIYTWFLYGMGHGSGGGSAGLSINGIAKELNERGVPCPASYKKRLGYKYRNPHSRYRECYWSGTSVSRILKDMVYTGSMVQGKFRVISYKIHKQVPVPREEWFVVANTHEPIIEQKIFDEVQRRMARDTRTAPGKKEVYLFSGFLRCPDCGRMLHRKTSKAHVYYFCRTPQLAKGACFKRSIRVDAVEAVVLKAIQTQIAVTDNLEQITERIRKAPEGNNYTHRLGIVLKQREKERAELEEIKDALYVDWKNGYLDKEEYLRMKGDFKIRLNEVEKAIEKIQRDCTTATRSGEQIECKDINSLKRDLLVDMVETILLYRSGAVEIKFKFADPYR